MALTEEQKEIALRLMMEMREEEPTGGSDEDFVLEIFSRFLAALPKPEAAGEIVAFSPGLHEVAWPKGKMPPLGLRYLLMRKRKAAKIFIEGIHNGY